MVLVRDLVHHMSFREGQQPWHTEAVGQLDELHVVDGIEGGTMANVEVLLESCECLLSYAREWHLGKKQNLTGRCYYRADSKLAPSQWEISLPSNAVSSWLGTNFHRNSYIFINENPFHNIVWKMVAILFRLNVVRYWLDAVKQSSHHDPYLSRWALLEVVAEHTKHDVTSCHKQCLVRGYHPIIHNKPDIWRATKTSVFRKSIKQHPHYLTH